MNTKLRISFSRFKKREKPQRKEMNGVHNVQPRCRKPWHYDLLYISIWPSHRSNLLSVSNHAGVTSLFWFDRTSRLAIGIMQLGPSYNKRDRPSFDVRSDGRLCYTGGSSCNCSLDRCCYVSCEVVRRRRVYMEVRPQRRHHDFLWLFVVVVDDASSWTPSLSAQGSSATTTTVKGRHTESQNMSRGDDDNDTVHLFPLSHADDKH